MDRRGFLVKKVLVPVAGPSSASPRIWPLASLGDPSGPGALHTKWYPGARLVTEDGHALHVDDVIVDGLLTVFPEGYVDDPIRPRS